ncbi:MAG: 4-hydroxy-tetrahydrodipicolinate reductase [Candidatus Tokpelaia sp. JSC188]|nr:MAG: 4-hydroxy-tetrahydrodipicolinate reductase [Candidatus Tokpelaia sp. JSC188]
MRFAVIGASGKMGRELIRAVAQTDGIELAAAVDRQGSEWLGKDAGILAGIEPLGIKVTSDIFDNLSEIDGILDFTRPEVSVIYADHAARMHIVHIIGTTGFSETDEKKITTAARQATIVKSSNMSLAVNLLVDLTQKAAQIIGSEDFDIEIVEMHHRYKVDAPSGTALLLAKAIAKGRTIDLAKKNVCRCNGYTGPREEGSIGFASLRGGTVVGEHSVIFAGKNERIILSHVAEDRSIFAYGAVKAAFWAQSKPPGLYSMLDVLTAD